MPASGLHRFPLVCVSDICDMSSAVVCVGDMYDMYFAVVCVGDIYDMNLFFLK